MNISNTDSTIDTLTLISEFEDYKDEKATLEATIEEIEDQIREENAEGEDVSELENDLQKAQEELQELEDDAQGLEDFYNEAEGYCEDFQYGAPLIHEDYFEEYMDQMLEDLGEIPDVPSYITITIDYDALREDYTTISFDGQEYLCR